MTLPNRIRGQMAQTDITPLQKWQRSVRVLAADMQNFTRFTAADQAILMKKLIASFDGKPAAPGTAELAESFRSWRQHADTVLNGPNAANSVLMMQLISKSSNYYTVTPQERAAEGRQLQTLIDVMTDTPQPPPMQKSVVRMLKAFCRQPQALVEDRVRLLEKLGAKGPQLHAAPMNDLRASHNVQGHAYKLFKRELERLPAPERAAVALGWAQQDAAWSRSLRTLSGQHWKNIGYAGGVIAVAGVASGGIAAATILGTSGAVGVGVIIGSAIAKSAATGSLIGAVSGAAGAVLNKRTFGDAVSTAVGGIVGGGSGIIAVSDLADLQVNAQETPPLPVPYHRPPDNGGTADESGNVLHAPVGEAGSPLDAPAGEGGDIHVPHTTDESGSTPDAPAGESGHFHDPHSVDESGGVIDHAPDHGGATPDPSPADPHSSTTGGAHHAGHGISGGVAAATAVGAIGSAIVVGALSSYLSNRVVGAATRAVINAGGAKGVADKLRKNPVVSIQTAVRRTSTRAFSFALLPADPHEKADAVRSMGPLWLPWVDTALAYPPAVRAKIVTDLHKTFDCENYHPEDRRTIDEAVGPARERLALAMESVAATQSAAPRP